MVAFSPHRGFAPTRNGRSWFKYFATRNQAIEAKRELIAAGIRYKCKKVLKPERQQSRWQPDPPGGGFGGRLNATPISGAWRLRSRRA
jgi:hypothetical protein